MAEVGGARNPVTVSVRWDDLPSERPRAGLERCAIASDEAMVVRNLVTPEMTPRPHRHDFSQIALVTAGDGVMEVDGIRYPVQAGSVMVIPRGAVHHLEAVGVEPVENIDIFVPSREDYAHLLDWMARTG
jgi:quercetin dioxygenase-like cupin family protein